MTDYSEDYLLDKRIKMFQPQDGYRASSDAVLLAAAAHRISAQDKILDVGSGTGAISLCIAERFKHLSPQITGIELQSELANLANLSAHANGFKNLNYINADIFNSGLDFCSFNHVFSNPPYFTPNMPTSPLKGKATAHTFTSSNIEDWITICIKMLCPHGYFYMINRAEALKDIIKVTENRLGEICIFPVYSKKEQNAKRIIIRARKDSKAPLQIMPPLQVHDDNGEYTAKAQEILRKGLAI